jgi:hypothetical protein
MNTVSTEAKMCVTWELGKAEGDTPDECSQLKSQKC